MDNVNKKKYKIAIISPAPFYYHVSLYRRLSDSLQMDSMVYYCSDEVLHGKDIEKTYLVKARLSGDDILQGYNNTFVKNYSPFPSYLTWPFGLINFGIWQHIKQGKYDAVVLQSWTNVTWWVAFFACLRFKTPIFFMTDANVLSEASRSFAKKVIKKFILNFLFKRTAGFLTTGVANEEFYKHYGADTAKMVRFYFSWGYKEFFEKAQQIIPKRSVLRKSLGIQEDDFLVLYVGRLSEEKDPKIILTAFNLLPNKNKKLFFVGDGPLRKDIERQIKVTNAQGVSIIGFKNRDSIGDFYAVADVLVLPSSSETWGIVVNEAMCFGLPIIASDKVGAAVDLVKDACNGFIFPVGNSEKLAHAMGSLMGMLSAERAAFGVRSKEIIKEWIDKIDPVSQLMKLLSPAGSFSGTGKSILMISPHLPWPLHGGPAVRIFNMLKGFSQKGYQITLLAGSKDIKLDPASPLTSLCEQVYLYQLPNWDYRSFALRSLFSLKPYPALRFQSPSLKMMLQRILQEKKFDAIWINFSILADMLPCELVGNTPIILDQHECEELVYKDYLFQGRIIERVLAIINLVKLKWFHDKVFPYFDAILCVSKDEADFTARQTKGNIKVWIVPNGVNREVFYPSSVPENKPNRIMLCSGMTVRRNIDAVVWFVKEIFPQVKKHIPDAEFWVVGSGPNQEVLQLGSVPGVKVVGAVEKIEDYYKMGKVFVAPYRFGAGTKLKVFEAMASGIPVVTTPIGCRGIEVVDKEHVLIANNEADFARSVVDVLNNPSLAKKLSDKALVLVKEKYYWEKVVNELDIKLLHLINHEK